MLHLILGGAGTGKSTRISEMIARDVAQGKQAYLIIPEQQANLSERTILPRLPAAAGLTFTIAGFSKLFDRVASQYGGITSRPPERSLRMLLLWECLRTLSPLLEEYRLPEGTPPDAALTDLMLQTMEELQAGAISPSTLEQAADALPSGTVLKKKLRDISLLYATYEARIAAVCESDGSDTVALLAALLRRHRYFADANVYIDSFTDFTAEEYAVLRELLQGESNVTVALCCDKLHTLNPAFACAADTANRLLRLANECGVPTTLTGTADRHRTQAPELLRLAERLWDLSYRAEEDAPIPPEHRGSITLLQCTNVYAESEALALHLLDHLHRGIPYGQMAIIVRDTEPYRGVLDAALERHGIPFYFSDKSALDEKPLCRFVLSALRAVTYRFAAQDVLTLIKTGLLDLPDADLDLFEQYVDTWGITGNEFVTERWLRNPDGYTDRLSPRGEHILAAANRVRDAVIPPLLRLYTELHAHPALPDCCRALYDYMEQMGLSLRCALVAERELADGELKQAGETLRVYDAVVDALSALATALPDVTVTPSELCAALTLLFSESELASVPSMHDSVTVGTADTLRVEGVSLVLLAGLAEGEFPRAVTDHGLLTDADKQQLEELGVCLEDRSERNSSRELMYVYRAMTKPSHALIVSTVTASPDGSPKTPGIAYARLLYLFPYLAEKVLRFDLSLLSPPAPPPTDAPAAPPTPPPPAPDGGTTDYAPHAADRCDLSPDTARSLLGDTLYLSQSRIQTFVQCPYRFYCTYVLELRERKTAVIDYADSGTFFHYLLEQVLRACMDAEGSFTPPAPEAIEPLADTFVNQYLRTLLAASDTDALRSARILHLFSRLRTLSLVLLRDVLGELSHSRFLPIAFELSIGGRSADAPPCYEVELSDGSRILLGGKVDRVDCYLRDGVPYLRVVDYKSGAKDFSLADVRRGFHLQLLLYLFALCRRREGDTLPRPAGVMYLSVEEEKGVITPHRSGLLTDESELLLAMNDECDPHYLAGIRQRKSGEWYGSALTPAAQFAALERDLCATLRAIGEDMRAGHAARSTDPDHCTYCPLREHCSRR